MSRHKRDTRGIWAIFRESGLQPEGRVLLALVAVTLAVGTFFYAWAEGWSLFDSLYFCVITLSTIGYGDLTPKTTLGKAFTMFYVVSGVGLLIGLFDLFTRLRVRVHMEHDRHRDEP